MQPLFRWDTQFDKVYTNRRKLDSLYLTTPKPRKSNGNDSPHAI